MSTTLTLLAKHRILTRPHSLLAHRLCPATSSATLHQPVRNNHAAGGQNFRPERTEYANLVSKSLLPGEREQFWMSIANREITWTTPPSTALSISPSGTHNWFPSGTLNMSQNCLDRHLPSRSSQVAIAYHSSVGGNSRSITYEELLNDVSKFAGGLRSLGVEKGDRVLLYMPMVPEAAVAMLACARIGAVHSVVFGGFAAKELAVRITDASPKVIVTADCGLERARCIPYMPAINEAIDLADSPEPSVVVLRRPEGKALGVSYEMKERDRCFYETIKNGEVTAPVPLSANDPLYTIYTSGTTGDPKGVLRDNAHAVHLKYSMSSYYSLEEGETFFAASDIGWVVGHSYIVYAPLLHGCTSVLFEGKPVGTPDAAEYWRIIERYKVNAMFTAPTALRAIRRDDPESDHTKDHDISSLRACFVAGERADPDTIRHFEEKLGPSIPVVDHWWQTESGSPMCGVQFSDVGTVGGSCGLPLPGFDIQILNPETKERITAPGVLGSIAIKLPLPPGFMTTLYNNNERYKKSYLETFPGYYDAGDAGMLDENGYIHIMERTDDAINVAGHRISTGLLEETVLRHPNIPECAVIGVNDSLKGVVPVALFVVSGNCKSTSIADDVINLVREHVGPVASMKTAIEVHALPKTRSGKILRQVIRKIANGEEYKLPGTIEDASVVDGIIEAFGK
ncbi:hypothetical protein TrVE_jg831 [Triparma verrucosa]|uniref:Acetate--CoA ligase n=1 Tax=Triparma verrucosa TaxID=1606542 RepID=A0A9W6ZF59_9STRA|nr:hypothetical protein TrVE_jg831 [Triparma verrucosa]